MGHEAKMAAKIPGFSAEASLHPKDTHYESGQLSATLRKEQKVMIMPAIDFWCEEGLHVCCLTGSGWHRCFWYNP